MTVEWEQNKTLDEVMPGKGAVGEIRYTAPHALYIEFDTAYADTDPNDMFPGIYEWVQRNWSDISSGIVKIAQEQVSDSSDVEQLQKQVTWVIIAAIKKNGIEGVHFGKRAIEHGKKKAEMVANIHKERANPYQLMAENLVEIMAEHSQGTIENEAKDTGELKESMEWEVRGK